MLQKWLSKQWQDNKPLPLLSPLSALYGMISQQQKHAYLTQQKNVYRADVPVLVIGNITVGGSGKTPLIIELVHYFQKKGIDIGIISRGYGGNNRLMPCLVSSCSRPCDVGDEPCLIVQKTKAPMAVAPNRQQAIKLLLANSSVQMIICDDGLQHYALYRDAEWIVVDVERGFGAGKLLPQGFLREPIERLKNATVIYHGKNPDDLLVKTANFEPIYRTTTTTATMQLVPDMPQSYHDYLNHAVNQQPTNSILHSKQVCGVTGIGYPNRFFKTLNELGFEVVPFVFVDHHQFKATDFLGCERGDLANLPIVVSEKDMIKIQQLDLSDTLKNRLWVLPVHAKLSPAVYQKADEFIQTFINSSSL